MLLSCTFSTSVVPSVSQNLPVVRGILIRGRREIWLMTGSCSESTNNSSNWTPFSSFLREEAFLSTDLRSVSICLNCFHQNIVADTFKECKECIKRHLTKQSYPRNLFPLPPASPGSSFCSLSPRARSDRVLSFEENDSTAARDACDPSDLGLTSRPRANLAEPPQIDKWRISCRKKQLF